LGALISDVFRRIRSLFGATLEPQPQPQPSIKDDLATDSQLGLTANELAIWDAYSLLLEERGKLYYIDVSQLPASKHEIDRILKKAILHLSANGSGKEALNTCVCGFILLADCQNTQSLELDEDAVEGLSALKQVVQLSSLDDKKAAFSSIALEHLLGKAAKAEMDERLTEMKQFFRENNLDFPS
jgi:hypothetical protein